MMHKINKNNVIRVQVMYILHCNKLPNNKQCFFNSIFFLLFYL